jgi:putative acetyltransferase
MLDPMNDYTIHEDDLTGEPTLALLALHLGQMHANSPAGSVFALDVSGLKAHSVTVWTSWHDGRIASVGALKQWDADSGELKSMRTHPDFLRQGAATAMLEHIVVESRRRGLRRLSLETGSGDAFEPALVLYRKRGFVAGPAFGDYEASSFNQFFHLAL